MVRQIQRVKLKDQVADLILDMILGGGYEAGDRLPAERVLVEELGVSRTVIREALNQMETRGILRVEHGRGAVVSEDGASAIRDNLGLLLRMRPYALWEIVEIRKTLEVEVAGLAAERASAHDIAAMHVALNKMRDRIHAPEGYVEADIEFHRLLVSTTGNRVFLLILESINNLLLPTRQMTGARLSNARQALHEHEAILRRVEASDPEGAREEMRKHLESLERHIRATAEDHGRSDQGKGVIPLESG